MFIRNVAHRRDLPNSHWYFLGGGSATAQEWTGSALIGVAAGARFPADWRLEFAANLGILALRASFVRSRPEFAAAMGAGSVALASSGCR